MATPLHLPKGTAHAEAKIEEKIRHHYHQPKGVEQFDIEPTLA